MKVEVHAFTHLFGQNNDDECKAVSILVYQLFTN